MSRDKFPVTAAVRVLREHGVAFTHHPYEYEERGGTAVSARELGVDEHAVIKTLVMEDDAKRPLVVLMHGDREVSTKNLARQLGVKTIVAVRAGGRRPPLGLPGRRHQPVRHAARDAGLHAAHDRRPAVPLRQRRPARLPRRHDAGRPGARAAAPDRASRMAAIDRR